MNQGHLSDKSFSEGEDEIEQCFSDASDSCDACSEDCVPLEVSGLNRSSSAEKTPLPTPGTTDDRAEPIRKRIRISYVSSSISSSRNPFSDEGGINDVELPYVRSSQTDLRSSCFVYQEEYNEQLPIPENLGEHSWYIENSQMFKLGSSGFSYIGGIADKKMHGFGRLTLGDSRQFIEGKWEMNRMVELITCQLFCDPGFRSDSNQTVVISKRKDDYLLHMNENHYIARVILNDIDKLDFATSVEKIKTVFFEKVIVLEILVDEFEQKTLMSLSKIATPLKNAIGEHANPIVRANIFNFLRAYLNNVDLDLSTFMFDIKIPMNIQDAVADLLDCERRYSSNIYMFSNKVEKLRQDLRIIVAKVYNDGIAQHRQMLIRECPRAFPNLIKYINKPKLNSARRMIGRVISFPNLIPNIRELQDSKTWLITSEDMLVFALLASQPCFDRYNTFFENLVDRFCLTIHNIKEHTPPSMVIPVMSPVYGHLAQSFYEIISEIIRVVDGYEYADMLKYESGKWKLKDTIQWPEVDCSNTPKREVLEFFKSSERKPSLYYRSLDIQYNTIFQLMNYFSPENYIVNKKPYEFNFHVLGQGFSWLEEGLEVVKNKSVELANRLKNLPTERLVWLYLLDHTIHEVFKNEPKYQILLKPYNSLLHSIIEKLPTRKNETFRVMTHNILKFITSTAPYFTEEPGIYVEILVQQIWVLSEMTHQVEENPSKFSSFQDLIAEYNRYLSLKRCINLESTPGCFSAQLSQMMQKCMHIVVTSLKKTAPVTTLVGFMRSLNDFLYDFGNIDFLAIWFVKSELYFPKLLEKVDNYLSTSGHCSYRVIDIEKYVKVLQILGVKTIPCHYIIQILSELLECIGTCLDKQWQSGDVELQVTQLETARLLLDAIRKSFVYLKQQPDCIDFDTFKKDRVGPFLCVVIECTTLNDFKERIVLL